MVQPDLKLRGPIETIFLDAGGVLVHPNWTRIAALLRDDGVQCDSAALAKAELVVAAEMDDAELIRKTDDADRWTTFMLAVLARAGVPCDEALEQRALPRLRAIHGEDNLWEHVPAEVPAALARLRAQGRLVVVSNANGTVAQKFERLGIAGQFDAILDSFVERVEKPDPRLFQMALERASARAETTVHVGDFFHIDVVGARRAGLQGVLLDRLGSSVHRDCVRVGSLMQFAQLVEEANRVKPS